MKLHPYHLEIMRKLEDTYGSLSEVPNGNKDLRRLQSHFYEPGFEGTPLPIEGVNIVRIKKAMKDKGITQVYLANHIEISRSALHTRFIKRCSFMVEELLKISRVLRLDIATITDPESFGVIQEYIREGMEEVDDIETH